MTGIWSGAKSARNDAALADLAKEVRRDLEWLNFPAANWVPPTTSPDGEALLDVLVVGGGTCGQTLGFALMRDGIRNFRVVDAAPRGEEGPWATNARMEILRSPKHLTGPDLGVPSLTFRAWYEAQHGAAGWERLHKAGRLDWRDYLLWVREIVGVPVENGMAVTAFRPAGRFIVVDVAGAARPLLARKLVLAGGRAGSGGLRLPAWPSLDRAMPHARRRVPHSGDDIDPGLLRGARVAVLGAGASAFDCAATALEAGAREVTMHVRRPHLPQVNKSKWTAFPGFLKGYGFLDDATRWQLYSYIFSEQVPPPWESVLRCEAHAGFSIRFGARWDDVAADADGVTIRMGQEQSRVDIAMLATGYDVDITLEPLLGPHAHLIRLWSDAIPPEEAARHAETSRFPYLGPGMELVERTPGTAPWLANVHLYNWGSTVSVAALAGDIPGIAIGANRLSEALCRILLAEDIERHRDALAAHEDRELEPTRHYVAPGSRRG